MSGKKETLRAVIADDEALARTYLRELLGEQSGVVIIAECADGFEAIKACANSAPDIIFLDIQMPKLDGFEVAELIDDQIQIVFVTAYDEYAVRAFEVHAVDYLLKPFFPQRLAEAVERARRRLITPVDPVSTIAQQARSPKSAPQRIVIKDGANVVVIPMGDIDYLRAQGDYVALHTGGLSHLKHQTLTSLEQQLDPNRFVRIHRSTIVAFDRIARIEPMTKDTKVAILKDGTELPISRSGLGRLRRLMEV